VSGDGRATGPAAAAGRGETAASQAGSANGARGAANGSDRNAPGAGSGGNGQSAPAAGVEVTPASWGSILAQLDLAGLARQLANNCMLIGRSGALVRLGLDPRNNMMRVPGAVDKLTQALSKYFGEPLRIEFEAPVAGAETPAQAEKRAVAEEFDSARQSLESDPAVRALRETFGATLHPDSVRPLK
jgi:DNA polymerase-3 subunit gamma/tau